MARSSGWLAGLLLGLALASAPGAPEPLPDAPELPSSAPSGPAGKPASLTLSGRWVGRFEPGLSEYLEIYAERRFIWRTSSGLSAAGDVSLDGRVLLLTAGDVRRAFVYELTRDTLTLTPDAIDRPVPFGELAKMSPLGARQVVWLRQGRSEGTDLFDAERLADLGGAYRLTATAGRTFELTLSPAGRFTFRGPGGLAAVGTAALHDGVLELSAPPVLRRLVARLAFDGGRWRLWLRRHESDHSRPANDLADMPPVAAASVAYERPATPIAASLLRGRFESRVGGTVHGLVFNADGTATYTIGAGVPLACRWALSGLELSLRSLDHEQDIEVRVFDIQMLGDSLVLIHIYGGAYGSSRVLDALPPTGDVPAVYRPVPAAKG